MAEEEKKSWLVSFLIPIVNFECTVNLRHFLFTNLVSWVL